MEYGLVVAGEEEKVVGDDVRGLDGGGIPPI